MNDVGITLDIARARLDLYLAAEAKVLGSQAYEMDGRKLTRANLAEIREGIRFWSGQVNAANPTPRARGRMRGGTYRLR